MMKESGKYEKNGDMQQKIKKYLAIIMAIVLLGAMLILSRQAATYIPSSTDEVWVSWTKKEQTPEIQTRAHVVLDAGHGGMDPGKIGINQAKEKDINLQIAKKVKKYLEASDIQVTMVREEDKGLYEESDKNKKVTDMRNRVGLIDASGADIAVSIHQNSYQTEDVKGAQVFYYKNSLYGKEMAEVMQEAMIQVLKPDKVRAAKQNDSYYLLKKTSTPTIIVECGFLSNWEEAQALSEETYQERIAWAIHIGILRYLNKSA